MINVTGLQFSICLFPALKSLLAPYFLPGSHHRYYSRKLHGQPPLQFMSSVTRLCQHPPPFQAETIFTGVWTCLCSCFPSSLTCELLKPAYPVFKTQMNITLSIKSFPIFSREVRFMSSLPSDPYMSPSLQGLPRHSFRKNTSHHPQHSLSPWPCFVLVHATDHHQAHSIVFIGLHPTRM